MMHEREADAMTEEINRFSKRSNMGKSRDYMAESYEGIIHSRDCPGVFCSEKWFFEFVWVFRLLRFDYFPPFFDSPFAPLATARCSDAVT